MITYIFGGCFDPFHIGHDRILNQLSKTFPEDQIIVLPAANSPGKLCHSASLDRLHMLQLALNHHPHISLDTRELMAPGPSFSIDTFLALKEDHPALSLVIGYDQLLNFHNWKQPHALLEILDHIMVINRDPDGFEIPSFFDHTQRHKLKTLTIPHTPVSSSEIRQSFHPPLAPHKGLSPEIANYCIQHQLYTPIQRPYVVGITGRVGTGKTYATTYLMAHAHFVVIDLDLWGHYLLGTLAIKSQLISIFGGNILDTHGDIIRKKLGEIAFASSTALAALNHVIHPALATLIRELLKQTLAKEILIVGALIEELGLRDLCDRLVVIDAPDESLYERIGEKFNIISPHQRSREAYLNSADDVVTNHFNETFGPDILYACHHQK